MTDKLPISRVRTGKKFKYFRDDTEIIDKKELDYFTSLKIPPAWQNVRIAANKRAKILAVGTDKAGRLQYLYHPAFRAQQEQAKFERILSFARALPRMRQTTTKHLKHRKLDRQKVLAAVVQLMDRAYIRVGNDTYAKENGSHGITTIRSKHTEVKGDTIIFDYRGKSGQPQHKQITDKQLARIVKQLDELPGHEVFKYYDEQGVLRDVKSKDVNAYIKEVMGEEFSAKDFRTWAGTLLTAAELTQMEAAMNEKERKKTITACVKKVAKKLGNTPAVARQSYIDPRIIKAFMDGNDLRRLRETVKNIKQKAYFTPDEACVVQLLSKTT